MVIIFFLSYLKMVIPNSFFSSSCLSNSKTVISKPLFSLLCSKRMISDSLFFLSCLVLSFFNQKYLYLLSLFTQCLSQVVARLLSKCILLPTQMIISHSGSAFSILSSFTSSIIDILLLSWQPRSQMPPYLLYPSRLLPIFGFDSKKDPIVNISPTPDIH